jgi:beta-lactam-binding protein with PASTA domain
VTDPSQAGMVVDEQPSGGSRAPTGSQVTIYVGQSG